MLPAMFRTPGKLATIFLLVALSGNGTCPGDEGNDDRKGLAEVTGILFPDGVRKDFGKVPRGIEVRHAFRMVNLSAVPLRMVSLRCA